MKLSEVLHSMGSVRNIVDTFGDVIYSIPKEGDLVAFDAEFVSIGSEKYDIADTGRRIVSENSRQMLARISLVHGGPDHADTDIAVVKCESNSHLSDIKNYIQILCTGVGDGKENVSNAQIIVDDYIIPMVPVSDYLTRFSGLIAEDLYPSSSSHNLVTSRTACLKLRCFIDRKCVIVGHGLQKDFDIANIFVPSSQIRDTVNIWRLPNQRKLALRFLSYVVLQADIQVGW